MYTAYRGVDSLSPYAERLTNEVRIQGLLNWELGTGGQSQGRVVVQLSQVKVSYWHR